MNWTKNQKLITAPDYIIQINAPLIFLAGPIQGAERWQDRAIEIIQRNARELYIANPRRPISDKTKKKDFTQEMYDEQVDWERYYLKKACNNGVILFWMAKEKEHDCKRAYAQTTRQEFGEHKQLHQLLGVRIAVGIEEGYTGARYVRKTLKDDCPEIKIYSTLEDTCNEAIRLARLKH
ncbi:hypothetical protein JW756_03410 [Candidatus Woesearchaeota archaeon]|nr:hypothetical protein [Candidatus Woesearchaeota archaeon]